MAWLSLKSSTTGGSPAKNSKNDIAGWCQQLFPTSTYGGTATNNIKIERHNHKGTLFWCSLYDETNPHWCDCQDGYWKDSTIDARFGTCNLLMDSVTCQIPGQWKMERFSTLNQEQ